MLTTQDLHHTYSREQKFSFPDLNCQGSETLLILGESGVGKTTLLHILGGILKPSGGEVLIDNQSIFKQKGNKLDSFRGQNIGLVFQKPHFISSVSAEENLWLAQTMAGLQKNKQTTDAVLEQLNIAARKSAKTKSMSQGELQRLSIARAIINKPKVILADEPTSALDDKNCDEVIKLLTQQASEVGAALIIVTHDNRLKELFSNQVILN